jgi:hypothetical protein
VLQHETILLVILIVLIAVNQCLFRVSSVVQSLFLIQSSLLVFVLGLRLRG